MQKSGPSAPLCESNTYKLSLTNVKPNTQEKTERNHHKPIIDMKATVRDRGIEISMDPHSKLKQLLLSTNQGQIYQIYHMICSLTDVSDEEYETTLNEVNQCIYQYVTTSQWFRDFVQSLENINKTMKEIKSESSSQRTPNPKNRSQSFNSTPKLSPICQLLRQPSCPETFRSEPIEEVHFEETPQESIHRNSDLNTLSSMYKAYKQMVKVTICSVTLLTKKLSTNTEEINLLKQFSSWYQNFSINCSSGLTIDILWAFIEECSQKITPLTEIINRVGKKKII